MTFPIKNDTPQGPMCIWFCMHPYECKHYPLCIMQLTYCILYIAFCMSKFINNISWLFPSKMTPHKAQCEFVFLCIHMSAYIMHYEINILNFAWANSLLILVDCSHRKWQPTRHNVYLFLYASIWVHALCIMQLTYRIMHE